MRTPENVLTDSLFLTAFAQDLMIADLLRRMKSKGEGLRQRSKQNLNNMFRHLKAASHYADELREELFEADAQYKWKNIQVWQEESNELARIILQWEDREQMPEVCQDIERYIRSTKSDGAVDENMLKSYYLIKHSEE